MSWCQSEQSRGWDTDMRLVKKPDFRLGSETRKGERFSPVLVLTALVQFYS